MTKAPKRPRDLNQWAKRMVDIATGEASDRELTPEEQDYQDYRITGLQDSRIQDYRITVTVRRETGKE
jgi:hypothetical protein